LSVPNLEFCSTTEFSKGYDANYHTTNSRE
jgi:hypothetical protein